MFPCSLELSGDTRESEAPSILAPKKPKPNSPTSVNWRKRCYRDASVREHMVGDALSFNGAYATNRGGQVQVWGSRMFQMRDKRPYNQCDR